MDKDLVKATPYDLLSTAVQKGVDMQQFEKLLDLYDRWEKNQAEKAFATAMAQARKKTPVLQKDQQANFGGGKAKYKYIGLDQITEKISPWLGEHGFTYSWSTEQIEGFIMVHCDITHQLGHSKRTTLKAESDTSGNKTPIQAMGSAITYLQKYTLLSATGLAAGGDDDGQGTEAPKKMITKNQAEALFETVVKAEADEGALLAHFGVDTYNDMTQLQFGQAMAMLNRKIKKKGVSNGN